MTSPIRDITTIQYKNFQDLPPQEGDRIIHDMNTPLGDDWETDTRFIQGNYSTHASNYQFFQIAYMDSLPIGYFIIRSDRTHSQASYLAYEVVRYDFQKCGIGTALLEEIIKKVREIGNRMLIATCEESNLPFYQKFAERQGLSCISYLIGNYLNGAKKFRFEIEIPPNPLQTKL